MADGTFPFKFDKAIRIVTLCLMAVMTVYGLVVVLGRLIPFGIDEWRLIYNIKFKSAAELMGPLDFVQQFPRAYLQVVKGFSEALDYNYLSLRLLPYLAGMACMLLSYRLMNKLFARQQPSRYLFVLILIGSPAFFEYFVAVKQYTMDILLSLVVLWQLLEMQRLAAGERPTAGRYILLCSSFIFAPFFSYTYAIAVAPLLVIVFMHSIKIAGRKIDKKAGIMLRLWMPLIAVLLALAAFYKADAAQLMHDDKMHLYWGYLLMHNGFDGVLLMKAFYNLFALGGSGLLFEVILGGLSIAGFVSVSMACVASFKKKDWLADDYVKWYCAGLVLLVLLLYTMGKLPIGERRLNAFILPVTGILVVHLIERLMALKAGARWGAGLVVLLVVGAIGSVVSSPINELTSEKQKATRKIFLNTEKALALAREKRLPIFITPGIGRPYDKLINYPHTGIVATELCVLPYHVKLSCADMCDNVPGDWILKAFPGYNVDNRLRVYAIADVNNISSYMGLLVAGDTSVLVGDGVDYKEVKVNR